MMGKRTTASTVLKLMTPQQREALLTYFEARWENDVATGEMHEFCAQRPEIDRDVLAEAYGLVRREWKGVGS